MASNRPTYNSYNTKLSGKEGNTMSRSSYETNPVGALQERFQSRGITPQYRVVQAEGASHAPTFSFQVILGDLTATGSGSSKKQAKVGEREKERVEFLIFLLFSIPQLGPCWTNWTAGYPLKTVSLLLNILTSLII